MSEELIPISMFLGLTIVFCVFFWFRYRARSEMQQTFRAALDKGQELTPEIIDRLGHPQASKDKDMRLGVIWLALGVGIFAFGFGIPDKDDVWRIFAGIAAFPFAIGIAYMILHKFADRD
ncbi:MAG: hypothetical protein IIB74_08110 [Proteobacteria bacterium]|nr:hypothetical protein [Pseudomonadota bacterium]